MNKAQLSKQISEIRSQLEQLSKTVSRRIPARRATRSDRRTFVKTYGGQTYRVHKTDDGRFEFRGKKWNSLTAIANTITAEHDRKGRVSGPQFFGVRRRAKRTK